MPLRDHFHAPLYPSRPWESFHSRWANAIGDYLNRILPPRYVSEISTHLGAQVEADVAEFETRSVESDELPNGPASAEAVAVQTWAPPVATMVMPAVFPDDLEVRITDLDDDARLVAVVELVSPRNKDRVEARRGFAAKIAAYLQRGIGVVVLDIVSSRHFNLHNDLVDLLAPGADFQMPATAILSAVAYRPVIRQETPALDVWAHPLTIGGELPVVPLALLGTRAVPLDLNATYEEACRRARL
jgi:hypothetical protein